MIDINLLPKTAKRPIGSKYLRGITTTLVVLALLTMAGLQVWFNLKENKLKGEKNKLDLQFIELQPFLDEQAALQNRQKQVLALLKVRDEVKNNTITWSRELAFMLETLPPPTESGRPSVAFSSLAINALEGNARSRTGSDGAYEGLPIEAEMQVSGLVRDTETLANYLKTLQDTNQIGVSFSNASLNEESGFYDFNLAIGIVTGEQNGN